MFSMVTRNLTWYSSIIMIESELRKQECTPKPPHIDKEILVDAMQSESRYKKLGYLCTVK
jgi:hypothetical protein